MCNYSTGTKAKFQILLLNQQTNHDAEVTHIESTIKKGL